MDYPRRGPALSLRCEDLTRGELEGLRAGVVAHLQETCPGEVCMYEAIEHLKEAAARVVREAQDKAQAAGGVVEAQGGSLLRAFFKMHHIYSKHKRHDMMFLAKELGLGGFMV